MKRCGVNDHFHALKGLAAAAPMVRSVRSGPPSNGSEFTYTRPHQRWGVKDHFHTLGGLVASIRVATPLVLSVMLGPRSKGFLYTYNTYDTYVGTAR